MSIFFISVNVKKKMIILPKDVFLVTTGELHLTFSIQQIHLKKKLNYLITLNQDNTP